MSYCWKILFTTLLICVLWIAEAGAVSMRPASAPEEDKRYENAPGKRGHATQIPGEVAPADITIPPATPAGKNASMPSAQTPGTAPLDPGK